MRLLIFCRVGFIYEAHKQQSIQKQNTSRTVHTTLKRENRSALKSTSITLDETILVFFFQILKKCVAHSLNSRGDLFRFVERLMQFGAQATTSTFDRIRSKCLGDWAGQTFSKQQQTFMKETDLVELWTVWAIPILKHVHTETSVF